MTFENVLNAIRGMTYGVGIGTYGNGFGGIIATAITGFQGNLYSMGAWGGSLFLNPIVYGTAAFIAGEKLYSSQHWSVPRFLAGSLATAPVSVAGTLIGYGFIKSVEPLAEVALNAAIASAFIPATAVALVGGKYAISGIYSLCYKKPETEINQESSTSLPQVDEEQPSIDPDSHIILRVEKATQTEEEGIELVAIDHHPQLLEDGLNQQIEAPARPLSSPRQHGFFVPGSNQNEETATPAPTVRLGT